MNSRKVSTEKQYTPYQLEKMHIHLKERFEQEQQQVDDTSDVEFAYNNPANLERPLQRVKVEKYNSFPDDLLVLLDQLPRPLTIGQGAKAYHQVRRVVARYIYASGHN